MVKYSFNEFLKDAPNWNISASLFCGRTSNCKNADSWKKYWTSSISWVSSIFGVEQVGGWGESETAWSDGGGTGLLLMMGTSFSKHLGHVHALKPHLTAPRE